MHFQNLRTWLHWEAEAEAKQLEERNRRKSQANAEESGETLLDLVITHQEPSVGGKTVLRLVKRNRTLVLPWNRLRAGSPVLLTPTDDGQAQAGVVTRRDRESIEVTVDFWPEAERFRLDLSADEITRKRHAAALKAAENARGRAGQLRDVLVGEREPKFAEMPECRFETHLDASQQAAVRFALAAEDVAIIHGPPGTGKTTTVVELICQAVARGQKVLACAPSNTAVDNLLERLVDRRQRVVRLGHPARVEASLREFTLDGQIANHEVMVIVRDLLRQAEALSRKAGRFTRAKPAPGEKQSWRREAQQLKSEAYRLEEKATEWVLDRADVVCATLSFEDSLLGDRRFDLAVIDEACQSTEPGCWVPMMRTEKLVLAGDHCQLPPTVLSVEAARAGFSTSLLERLVNRYGSSLTKQLTIQYRMHNDIMRFSSEHFYLNTLEAHESVAGHLLHDLPTVAAGPITEQAVSFIDTAGIDWTEENEADGESKCNPGEGRFVLHKVRQLLGAGLAPQDIAVITPYAAQVRWLRDHWAADDLEIDTVDGFQGREKEAVLISCVRSNNSGELGFLSDTRRMNVALTRARRKLFVIGDSATLGGHSFFAAMLAYFESIGAYQSIWEEGLDF